MLVWREEQITMVTSRMYVMMSGSHPSNPSPGAGRVPAPSQWGVSVACVDVINTDNSNYYNTILCKIIHHSLLNFSSLLPNKTSLSLRLSRGESRGAQRGRERERQIWTNLMMKRKLFISSYNSSLLTVSRGSLSSRHSASSRLVQSFLDWLTDWLTNWKNAKRKFDSICSKIYYVHQLHWYFIRKVRNLLNTILIG